MRLDTATLGIIGAGNMAEAIARGVISAGLIDAARMTAADPSSQRLGVFADLGVRGTGDNREPASCDLILLSVKPQHMGDVLRVVAGEVAPGALVISIAAGVTTARIEAALGAPPRRVVRVMPNTPMLMGAGAAAICPGAAATADDLRLVRRMFECCGIVVDVEEAMMDAVTALSGSGPAYFFLLVEQMIEAGLRMGLPAETARALAAQTAAGAGAMLARSGETPQELRRRVTSPGGTTEAALRVMEQRGLPETVIAALLAAEARGRELGRGG